MGPVHKPRVRPRGLLEEWLERLRGREQKLVRAAGEAPLLLLSYPRRGRAAADETEAAYTHTLPRLNSDIRAPYHGILERLPVLVVVLLRPRNLCDCLGHHHPRGTESRLTRRLAADLGSPVGEIDLAYEAIRRWEPQPLAAMAVGELGPRLPDLHFQAAVLAVLLHELEHLAFARSAEHETRTRSNWFYTRAMEQLVAEESGAAYGMAASRPPCP
jgi:hypothetical protein